jgi:hypothetical protein
MYNVSKVFTRSTSCENSKQIKGVIMAAAAGGSGRVRTDVVLLENLFGDGDSVNVGDPKLINAIELYAFGKLFAFDSELYNVPKSEKNNGYAAAVYTRYLAAYPSDKAKSILLGVLGKKT